MVDSISMRSIFHVGVKARNDYLIKCRQVVKAPSSRENFSHTVRSSHVSCLPLNQQFTVQTKNKKCIKQLCVTMAQVYSSKYRYTLSESLRFFFGSRPSSVPTKGYFLTKFQSRIVMRSHSNTMKTIKYHKEKKLMFLMNATISRQGYDVVMNFIYTESFQRKQPKRPLKALFRERAVLTKRPLFPCRFQFNSHCWKREIENQNYSRRSPLYNTC